MAPSKVVSNKTDADAVAIIAAGGIGERFGCCDGKQLVQVAGKPLAAWSILAFDACPSVGELVVVCSPDRRDAFLEQAIEPLALSTPVVFADSGDTRQQSVYSGLIASSDRFEFAAIHDAARPLILVDDIEAGLTMLRSDRELDGVVCSQCATDTLKHCDADDVVVSTPRRAEFWYAQTPQTFRRKTILAAQEAALMDGVIATDDSCLVERVGGRVRCYASTGTNLKVTYPDDLLLAQSVLEMRLTVEGIGSGRIGFVDTETHDG